jgi:hypothetical protein
VTDSSTVQSPVQLARIAGGLYLVVGIAGGFAEGYVEPGMYVAGDAAATATNVIANPGLVRLGVIADLVDQAFFVFTVMALYLLLRHVQRSVAGAMVIFVILAVAIASLNTVFEFEGLRVATDPAYLAAFGQAGLNALVLMLLDMQHYGLLIAQIFFGLWLIPLGTLAYRSEMFPKALGIALVVGGVCYLVDLLAAFALPDVSRVIHGYVVIPCAIAEIWMVAYLLIFGVNTARTGQQPLAAA